MSRPIGHQIRALLSASDKLQRPVPALELARAAGLTLDSHNCARLVRSCRPWREAQEAMFAIIARQPGRPSKAEVIEATRHIDQQEASCRSA